MSTYKDRYKDADNGLRFQDLVYQGNFKDMDPVPDGILGDKVLRQRAKSKVLEKVTKEAAEDAKSKLEAAGASVTVK